LRATTILNIEANPEGKVRSKSLNHMVSFDIYMKYTLCYFPLNALKHHAEK